MASAFNVFLAAMWIERNIRGATLHRKQKQKQMKKNKMLSDAKKVLYLVLMFACSGPAYAGIRSRKQNCWSGILWYDILNSSLVCHLSLMMRWWMASFCVSFSPKTVGAYRIRPDVGEKGKMAASNPSFFRESPHCLTCSPMWRAYALAPLHNYHLFVGGVVMDGVV